MDFVCGACGWSGHPKFEMVGMIGQPTRIAAACTQCVWVHPTLNASDFNSGVSKSGERVSTVVERPAAPPALTPRAVPVKTSEPIDIVAAARERAAYLQREIAIAEGHKIELRRLTKFLAAMEPRPRDAAFVGQDIQ